MLLGQVGPGLGTVRAVTRAEGKTDFHLAGLGVQAAVDGLIRVDLVTGQAGAVRIIDAVEQRRRFQNVGRALLVVTGSERLGRVIAAGQRVVFCTLALQERGRRGQRGRILRLAVLQQHLGHLVAPLRLLDGVLRLVHRLRGDGPLGHLRRVAPRLLGHLLVGLVDRVGHSAQRFVSLILSDDAVLDPAVRHVFHLGVQLGHIRRGLLGHGAEEELRGLSDFLSLGSVLARHGNY